MKKCIVCGNAAGKEGKSCRICGFSQQMPRFLSEKQYQIWLDEEVRPYQQKWKEKTEKERIAKEKAEKKKAADRICQRASGLGFEIRLKGDGTVSCQGNHLLIKNAVDSWRNITAVSCGLFHVVGLKRDGTVVAAGKNTLGQCDVSTWRDIVQISAGGDCSAALDSTGHVHITGDSGDYGIRECTGWTNVKKISMGGQHILGLLENDTVMAAGANMDGQCEVSGWFDVTDIEAGTYDSKGIRRDQVVLTAGTADEK